jgi:hypothetical protein
MDNLPRLSPAHRSPARAQHKQQVQMRSELGCRSRQTLPVLALFLPVHQDVKIGRALLAVGDGLTFAHPVESHDRGGADDADRGVLVFQRQPLRFSVGGVGYKGRLVRRDILPPRPKIILRDLDDALQLTGRTTGLTSIRRFRPCRNFEPPQAGFGTALGSLA